MEYRIPTTSCPFNPCQSSINGPYNDRYFGLPVCVFSWRGWIDSNDTEIDVTVTQRDMNVHVDYQDNDDNEHPYVATLVLDDWARRPELVRHTLDLFTSYRVPTLCELDRDTVNDLFCGLSFPPEKEPLGSTGEQKVYVLIHVVRDILDYINRVFELYPGRVQEYVMFVRSRAFVQPPDMNAYDELVHDIACRVIRDHALRGPIRDRSFTVIPRATSEVSGQPSDDKACMETRSYSGRRFRKEWEWVVRARKGITGVDGAGNPFKFADADAEREAQRGGAQDSRSST